MDLLALLAIALLCAKVVGGLLDRIDVPAVLGELFVGIVIGNLGIVETMTPGTMQSVQTLSDIGVLFLMFMVGLETDLKGLRSIGVDAVTTATVGAFAPMALGIGAVYLLGMDLPMTQVLVLAASLAATSVGITARILKDTRTHASISGRIILAAAVVDDVWGILVLAVLSGLVTNGDVSPLYLAWLLVKVALFMAGVYVVRRFFLPNVYRGFRILEISGTVTTLVVSMCICFAWMAEWAGLAGIIGAFTLGVALDRLEFQGYKENLRLEDLMKPMTDFFVPIFFIAIGMEVKASALLSPDALGLAAVMLVCGIIGKFACGAVIRPQTVRAGASRAFIAVGMLPRGEVALIFAATGQKLGVLDARSQSAIIMMTVVTSLVSPFLLFKLASKLPDVERTGDATTSLPHSPSSSAG